MFPCNDCQFLVTILQVCDRCLLDASCVPKDGFMFRSEVNLTHFFILLQEEIVMRATSAALQLRFSTEIVACLRSYGGSSSTFFEMQAFHLLISAYHFVRPSISHMWIFVNMNVRRKHYIHDRYSTVKIKHDSWHHLEMLMHIQNVLRPIFFCAGSIGAHPVFMCMFVSCTDQPLLHISCLHCCVLCRKYRSSSIAYDEDQLLNQFSSTIQNNLWGNSIDRGNVSGRHL